MLAEVRGSGTLIGCAICGGGRVGDSVLGLGLTRLFCITLRLTSMHLMTRVVMGTVAPMLGHLHRILHRIGVMVGRGH